MKNPFEKANLHIRQGLSYEQAGKPAEALREYDAALAESIPAEPAGVVWFNKGNVLKTLKRTAEAESAYLRSLQCPPPEAFIGRVFQNLTVLLIDAAIDASHRFHEALVCADRGIKFVPDFAPLWASRAVALYYLDRYVEAETAAKRALALDPKVALAGFVIEQAPAHIERMLRGLRDVTAEVKLNPRAVEGWRRRLVALLNLGRVTEAFAVAADALKINSLWHEIYGMKAAGCLALGDWNEAIRQADQALAITARSHSAAYMREAAIRCQSFERKLQGGS